MGYAAGADARANGTLEDLLAAVRNQLLLAREVAEAVRHPWEARVRPATLRQVRRAMGRIIAQVYITSEGRSVR